MVNSAKNILNKKNHLTCDSTIEEVLTTTLFHHQTKPNKQNLTFSKANIVIRKKEMSQIWCRDQDFECRMVKFV